MPSSYDIPIFGTGTKDLLPWLLGAVEQGEAWRTSQQPTVEWQKVREMLGVQDPAKDLEGQSNVGYNKGKRIFKELVASLSNFRYEGEFKPRFDKDLYKQAHVLTKRDHAWNLECNSYDAYRAGTQYAIGFGTGYWVEEWDPTFHGSYGDVRLQAYGPDDVTVLQMPRNHDLQKAYAVIIREEMPLNLAKATYEHIAGQLVPDRQTPQYGAFQKGLRKVQQYISGSPFLRAAGNNKDKDQSSFPTVDIFKMYTMDRAINVSTTPVKMGAYGTNWNYTVPALGDPMPTGTTNPQTGEEWTRPALEADCRLFPLRRLTIFSRTAVAYDGSSPWWHGQVPVARLRFNDLAWEALGQSLMGDIRTMQDGIIAIMRLVEDNMACRLHPPVLYDDQLVSEGFAKNFNAGKAGVVASGAINQGDLIKFPVPKEQYEVPTMTPEWVKEQEARMDYMAGTPDLVAMAKAKQVPGEGTLEKLREMAGPIVEDMVRAYEQPLWQLGEWRKAYYFQFDTHGRILKLAGPDETSEDFQYHPDLIIPLVPGESLEAKRSRAKRYLSEFKFHLTESGYHEFQRLMNRLSLLQLQKAGMPIDWWTLAKAFKIVNFGAEPGGTNNVMERWIAQQHMQRELAEEMAEGLGGGQVGRPATNKKPPTLVGKDHGTRSTVKTS